VIVPDKCAAVAAALITEHDIELRDPADDNPGPLSVCEDAVNAMEPEDVLAVIWTCQAGGVEWFVSCVSVSEPHESLHEVLKYAAMVALDMTIQEQLAAK
jgi:hypothetical protein